MSLGLSAAAVPRFGISAMRMYAPNIYHDVLVAHDHSNEPGEGQQLHIGWLEWVLCPAYPMIEIYLTFADTNAFFMWCLIVMTGVIQVRVHTLRA